MTSRKMFLNYSISFFTRNSMVTSILSPDSTLDTLLLFSSDFLHTALKLHFKHTIKISFFWKYIFWRKMSTSNYNNKGMIIMWHHHMTSSYDIIKWHHHMASSYVIIICHHHMTSSYDVIICYHHMTSSYDIIIWCDHMIMSYDDVIWWHISKNHIKWRVETKSDPNFEFLFFS